VLAGVFALSYAQGSALGGFHDGRLEAADYWRDNPAILSAGLYLAGPAKRRLTVSRWPWAPKHFSHPSVPPHLSTIPELWHRRLSAIAASNRFVSP
jgi:hypothetical protein